MGGLRLSDFADPDDGLSGGNLAPCVELSLLGAPTALAPEPNVDSQAEMDMTIELWHEETAESLGEATPKGIFDETARASSPSSEADEGDSPLGIARGGPVVIPQIPYHTMSLRAETGSPYRSLPSPQSAPCFVPTPELDTLLPKPSRLSTSSGHTPSESSRTPMGILNSNRSVPASVGPAMMTPTARGQMARPEVLALSTKPKTISSTAPGISEKPVPAALKADRKTAKRTLAIRGKLDAAFSGKLSAMGPPQRVVSGASAASGSSSHSHKGPHGSQSRSSSSASSRSNPSARSQASTHIGTSRMPSNSESNTQHPPRPKIATKSAGFAKPTASSLANSRPIAHKPRQIPATASSQQQSVRPSTVMARPPLIPRALPQQAAAPRIASSAMTKSARLVPVTKAAASFSKTPVVFPVLATEDVAVEVAAPSNPLQRPLVAAQPTLARSLVSTAPGVVRPTMGLPSRLVHAGPPTNGGTFSIGTTAPEPAFSIMGAARPGYRSPRRYGQRNYGSPMVRDRRLGTPSRLGMGTPLRPAVRRPQGTPVYVPYNPPRPVASIEAATADSEQPTDPPADKHGSGGTAQESSAPASEAIEAREVEQAVTGDTQSETAALRSSLDAIGVFTASAPSIFHSGDSTAESTPPLEEPPSSSLVSSPPKIKPEKTEKERHPIGLGLAPGRPKRAVKPPSAPTTFYQPQPRHINNLGFPSIAPNLSEKELKVATQRNTAKNEKYNCVFEREIVHVNSERPASPTSKIRTIADREEEERKQGRDERAKRRSRGPEGDDEEIQVAVIERVSRFRGDEDDYTTPARALKKAKVTHAKTVRWDKGLLIIRDDVGKETIQRESPKKEDWPRGCIKNSAKVTCHSSP